MFYPANCSGWFCFSSTAVPFCLVIAGYYGAEVPLADSVQLLQSTASTVYSQRRYVEAYNTIHTPSAWITFMIAVMCFQFFQVNMSQVGYPVVDIIRLGL